ncbi:MAG: CPBP family intramembrane metalloprotease [Deltaproteobacteria bacterium]|nr:CPBP family intramembrane metalloprotease [Deltaproteobacteria bacterium]
MEAKEIPIRTLFLCLGAVFVVELGARVVTAKSVYHPMLILGGARLLEILLIALIVVTWGQGLSSIGLARSEMVSGLKKGLLWSAGFGAVTSIVCVGLFAASVNPLTFIRAHIPTQTSDLIYFFIVGGILGPVAEELFFRGILYGFLRRWGVIVALVFSTLIFVLCHPISHGIPVSRLLGGLLFALAYEFTGSLMVPITIHALGNLAIFTLSLVF